MGKTTLTEQSIINWFHIMDETKQVRSAYISEDGRRMCALGCLVKSETGKSTEDLMDLLRFITFSGISELIGFENTSFMKIIESMNDGDRVSEGLIQHLGISLEGVDYCIRGNYVVFNPHTFDQIQEFILNNLHVVLSISTVEAEVQHEELEIYSIT